MIRIYSVGWTKERRLNIKSFPSKTEALAHAKNVVGDATPTSTVWCYEYDGNAAAALATANDKPNSWWDDARMVRVFRHKPAKKEKTNDEA